MLVSFTFIGRTLQGQKRKRYNDLLFGTLNVLAKSYPSMMPSVKFDVRPEEGEEKGSDTDVLAGSSRARRFSPPYSTERKFQRDVYLSQRGGSNREVTVLSDKERDAKP